MVGYAIVFMLIVSHSLIAYIAYYSSKEILSKIVWDQSVDVCIKRCDTIQSMWLPRPVEDGYNAGVYDGIQDCKDALKTIKDDYYFYIEKLEVQ